MEYEMFRDKVVFAKAHATVMKQTAGNYPAPLKILECVKTGLNKGRQAGYQTESKVKIRV